MRAQTRSYALPPSHNQQMRAHALTVRGAGEPPDHPGGLKRRIVPRPKAVYWRLHRSSYNGGYSLVVEIGA